MRRTPEERAARLAVRVRVRLEALERSRVRRRLKRRARAEALRRRRAARRRGPSSPASLLRLLAVHEQARRDLAGRRFVPAR